MIFKDPLILLMIPVFLIFFFAAKIFFPERAFLFPADEILKTMRPSFKAWLARQMIYLKVFAVIIFIAALARPQASAESDVKKEGIAIVLAMDCSSTMLAEDLELGPLGITKLVSENSQAKRINRMDAVRELAKDFISSRPDDMIGIVAFAARAYVVSPPTFDKEWLMTSLGRVNVGLIKDGTAIGSGILSSLESLKAVAAKSKIIVLFTDGINNYGEIPPLVAAKAARSLGVKIYTIGIASGAPGPFPVKDSYGRKTYENVRIDIDEDTLKKIADLTGGNYYKVSNLKALKNSYDDINKLESSELEEISYEEYEDIFPYFLLVGLIFLAVEILLSSTFLRKVP